jgi:hypothetical protein
MSKKMAAAAGIVALAACASSPRPTEHLAASMAAVQSAQTAGAGSEPQAELHLKLAQEQIEQAKTMMEHGQNERADAMTIRAFNFAQLALAIAREAQIKRSYQEFAEAHPELRDQGSSNSGAQTGASGSNARGQGEYAPSREQATPRNQNSSGAEAPQE